MNKEHRNSAESAESVMWMLGEEADEYSRLGEEEAHWLTVRDQAIDEVERYTAAVDASKPALAEMEAALQDGQDAVDRLTGAMDEGNDTADESVSVNEDLQSALADVYVQVDALAEAYAEAYNAAYESVTGQYAIWDDAAEKIPTDIESINKSMTGQIDYWREYNANLQALAEKAGEIDGLSEVIASFADGSEESVNAVAGMAAASDEDLAAMVANWRELQEEHEAVSGSIAEITTSYQGCIDEFQRAIESEIGNMELSAEAKSNAIATIQGYIDGANSMIPQVRSAYNDVAYAAERALFGFAGGTGSRIEYTTLPGFASGTGNASPGVKLVGENGPELEFFRGGEKVVNARETADILSGGGDTVYELTLSPSYQISGTNDPEELRRILEEHDGQLLDKVSDMLYEREADAVRRRYR